VRRRLCANTRAKLREAGCSTILSGAPEAMGKSDKEDCLESEKANGCKIRPSVPEAMPKSGSARRSNMNSSNLHTSQPRVPEYMLKINGASYTVGELEP
jgi:hypothetical protein